MSKRQLGKIKDQLGEFSYFDREAGGDEILGKKRISAPLVVILFPALFLLVLAAKLYFLQIQEGLLNLKLAQGNSVRNITSPAPRGIITTSDDTPLVKNEPAFDLLCELSKPKDLDKLDGKVFEIVGISKEELKERLKNNQNKLENLVVREKIDRDEALLLKSRLAKYGGFEVVPSYVRNYSEGSLCYALGYIGKVSEGEATDNPSLYLNGTTGKSALEKTYDQYLQGTPGVRRAEVDATGKIIRLLSQDDPKVGATIKTSINLDLQKTAFSALAKKTDELKTKGVVVILDPRDSSILALVSTPGYDNTAISRGLSKDDYQKLISDKNHPLLNRAIAGEYPSGSSIKPFIAASALEFGIVNDALSFDTPPFIDVGGHKFPDWKDHGVTDIRRAIAESNNIFFFALGGGYGPIKDGLGPDGIKKGLNKFGFGSPTGIDLDSEKDGFIPTPEWKKKTFKENWYTGNTYNMAIGQGDLLVTPLQTANATGAIANGGKLYRPHLISKISSSEGVAIREFKGEDFLEKSDIFSAANLQVVREGMRMTVTDGSANSVFGDDFPVSVAAKTGTAQFGNEDKTHAWFSSFAPYDNPEIVVTVLVEGGGEGYQTAAPVAKEILDWWSRNK